MSILYRRPSIDASCQVSDNLALWLQRRRLKCVKLTDDGCQVMAKALQFIWESGYRGEDNRRRMPSDGKSSHCSSFGKAVIEEKIF